MRTTLIVLRLAAVALLLASCMGALDTGPRRPPVTEGPVPPRPCESTGMDPRTDVVRRGLARTCEGCHASGEYGYFASAVAFESLLVRNPRFVVPGDPDGSVLVQLLEGTRTGSSLTQMPLSGDSFAELDARGETDISTADVRAWIADLTTPAATITPDADAPTVQRLSAIHFERGLRDLLGLTHEDFFMDHPSVNGSLRVQARSPDAFAVRSPDRVASVEGLNRFEQLGGASAMTQRMEDRTPSTTFVQTLVPLSQAWCQRAVAKVGNTALFTTATAATTSADMEALRAQVADWHLLFLAQPATEDDIDVVVDGVFAPLESESDAETAWVGTCSYFIRHPLFVLY